MTYQTVDSLLDERGGLAGLRTVRRECGIGWRESDEELSDRLEKEGYGVSYMGNQYVIGRRLSCASN